MTSFSYKWLIVALAIPAFANAAEHWVTLKNGISADLTEMRVDSQRCKDKAASIYPSSNPTREFARAVGTDISSSNEILTSLGQQLRDQIQTAQSIQREIQEKESTNIFDSPTGWLHGQLTLEDDYRRYNQAVETAKLTAKSINVLTEATNQVESIQDNLAQKSDDTSLYRVRFYNSCMTTLGYERVLIQR